MSQIDDYFGFNEPKKEVKEETQPSLQERKNKTIEEGIISLGKTAEYFEEAYKKVVPEPNPELDKEIEEMFYESPIEPKNEPGMDYTMRRYHNKLSEILRYK